MLGFTSDEFYLLTSLFHVEKYMLRDDLEFFTFACNKKGDNLNYNFYFYREINNSKDSVI